MARKSTKVVSENVETAIAKTLTDEITAANDGTDALAVVTLENSDNIKTSENNIIKHVALHQLYFVKEYIDKKVESLLETLIESDSGIHGLRYKDGKLQRQDENGNWVDIIVSDSGSGGSTGNDGVLTDNDFASDKDVEDIFKIN